MVTRGAPMVKEDRMDPRDVRTYLNVAAYLRDVILAFKEEWEGEGYKPTFRSPRLEFHVAMVLTGGTFNSKNVRKVQDKFNVTWQDFVQRVEVTDVMKREQSARHLSVILLIMNVISRWKGEGIPQIVVLQGREFVWSG
jgi:hypothetical protein